MQIKGLRILGLSIVHLRSICIRMVVDQLHPSNPALPGAAATRAHCRRVAAWSCELAHILNISVSERKVLAQAALDHHLAPLSLSSTNRETLLADLRIAGSGQQDAAADRVHSVLAFYHGLRGGALPGSRRLATLLEMANALDEQFEWERLAPGFAPASPLGATALQHLHSVARVEVRGLLRGVPELPAVAQRCVPLLSADDPSQEELEAIARSDQALARMVVQTSASHPRPDGAGVPKAIQQLGSSTSARLLYAASLRRLFASASLRPVWNHSVDVAQIAEKMAEASGQCDPREAFLAGLVHDSGRLLLRLFPSHLKRRFWRALENGCERVLIESAFGYGHSAAGAAVMKKWNLSSALSRAVEFHHHPERTESKLASVLYLADQASDPGEDLHSVLRREEALSAVGLRNSDLAVELPPAGPLQKLKFAA